MALRPGRQRRGATPIITKGVLYPLQNPCASKSDTHHNTKGTRVGAFCVGWGSSGLEPIPRKARGVGPHSPPEDRGARLAGAGCANLRRRGIPCYLSQTKIRVRKNAGFCLYYSFFIIHHSLFIHLTRGFFNEE